MKTANPVAPGKKVKCAKCSEVFIVPEDDEPAADSQEDADEKPAKKGKAAEDDDEQDEADDKKKKPAAKKGLSGLMMGLLAGGAVLLCCCCTGGSGTGYWLWSKSSPAFVGIWESKNREADGSPEITLMVIENGKGNYLRANKPPEDFKWRTVNANTVEFEIDDPAKKKTFWVGNSRPNFNYTVENVGKPSPWLRPPTSEPRYFKKNRREKVIARLTRPNSQNIT